MNEPHLERGFFLTLLAAVTIAFVWLLLPFAGAVLWAVALAILFTPLYKWLRRATPGKPTIAALVTLVLCLVIVILPLVMLGISLVGEIATLREKIKSGQLDYAAYFQRILDAAPVWLTDLINRFDLGDKAIWQQRISQGAARASQVVATQALAIGQNTFEFVMSFFIMLYLLFFLLRDGALLSRKIRQALPLAEEQKQALMSKFATVIKATVKGNVAVALVQGTLGGLAYWFLGVQGALLWAALTAFLSLVPAVGGALVWLPIALYLLATGETWQGFGLIAWGALVIGSIDNLLRPILVGKETQMPDYVVLLATIGGIALFGINGFVIGPVIAALFMACWSLFVDSQEAGLVRRPEDL
ncbi:MAG: AI-2E family transporter [Burkholderiales bacterium]